MVMVTVSCASSPWLSTTVSANVNASGSAPIAGTEKKGRTVSASSKLTLEPSVCIQLYVAMLPSGSDRRTRRVPRTSPGKQKDPHPHRQWVGCWCQKPEYPRCRWPPDLPCPSPITSKVKTSPSGASRGAEKVGWITWSSLSVTSRAGGLRPQIAAIPLSGSKDPTALSCTSAPISTAWSAPALATGGMLVPITRISTDSRVGQTVVVCYA